MNSDYSNETESGDDVPDLLQTGSPDAASSTKKSNISQKSNSFSSRTIQSIVESRVSQLKAITLPSDTNQLSFLNSLQNFDDPQTLSKFLDYLIQQNSGITLEKTKLATELKSAKEELNITNNRSQRLLLHLQQNVKLLSQVATNEGETTLIQEAAQNLQSVGPLEFNHSTDYLKQLSQVLTQKRDTRTGLEVLELLKQEISINSIIRKQTQKLIEVSNNLAQSLQNMKSQIGDVSVKQMKHLKLKLQKRDNMLAKLTEIAKCPPEELETAVSQAVLQSNQLEIMKNQVQQLQNESKEKIAQMKTENDEVKKELNSMKKKLSLVQKIDQNSARIREQFVAVLGMKPQPKATPYSILVMAATNALPIVRDAIECHKKCGVEGNKNLSEAFDSITAEVQHLQDVEKQNKVLMQQQAATIQALQDKSFNSWKEWDADTTEINENSPTKSKSNSKPKSNSSTRSPLHSPIHGNESTLPEKSVNDNFEETTETEKISTDGSDITGSSETESNFELDVQFDQFDQFDQLRQQFNHLGKEIESLQSQFNGETK